MVLWDIQRSRPYPNGAVGYPKGAVGYPKGAVGYPNGSAPFVNPLYMYCIVCIISPWAISLTSALNSG